MTERTNPSQERDFAAAGGSKVEPGDWDAYTCLPNPSQPAPVSDAEAQEWARQLECVYQVTVNGEVKFAMFDCQDAARRLLADRARDKERIRRLEAALLALEVALADTPENRLALQNAYDGVNSWEDAAAILAYLRRAAGMEE